MAERERRLTPPRGGVFVPRVQVLTAQDVQRALVRIAHEIIERNHGLDDVTLVGLQTGGVPLSFRIASVLEEMEGTTVPVGLLDVAFYRDDIGIRPVLPEAATDIPGDLAGGSSSSSTTSSSPAEQYGRRSTPSAITAGPGRSSWR